MVEAAQHAFAAVDLHHVRAEPLEEGRELAGDVAATHDHQARTAGARGRSIWSEMSARSLPGISGTSAIAPVATRICLAWKSALAVGGAHDHRVRIDEPRVAGDQRGAGVVEQASKTECR